MMAYGRRGALRDAAHIGGATKSKLGTEGRGIVETSVSTPRLVPWATCRKPTSAAWTTWLGARPALKGAGRWNLERSSCRSGGLDAGAARPCKTPSSIRRADALADGGGERTAGSGWQRPGRVRRHADLTAPSPATHGGRRAHGRRGCRQVGRAQGGLNQAANSSQHRLAAHSFGCRLRRGVRLRRGGDRLGVSHRHAVDAGVLLEVAEQHFQQRHANLRGSAGCAPTARAPSRCRPQRRRNRRPRWRNAARR